MREVAATLGTPTILVNSAGIAHNAPAIDMAMEDWDRVLHVNLTGTFVACQAFARSCVAADVEGAIVNIASMSARIVNVPQSQCGYNASKAGVEALTRSLAIEWLPLGIRVNAISPGYVMTDLVRDVVTSDPVQAEIWRSRIPAGDLARPEDLAALVVYPSSSSSRYVVGQSLVVDGGYTFV